MISRSSLLLGIQDCHASKIVNLSDWPMQGGVAWADFDGDGLLDVVADDDKNIIVRVSDGMGAFSQSLSMGVFIPEDWPIGTLLPGDFNHDQKMDFLYNREGKGWGVFLNTCR